MSLHHHERIFIDGPAGVLQAIYQAGESQQPAVVVCHPHPQFGGTMRNKVVYRMARAFEDIGCSVLRFNYRGVEQSEGVWDEGDGESDDTAAVLDWLHGMHPEAPLWLAGFSFGCFAGLKAASHDDRVSRLFAVAPAVNLWNFDFMLNETRPLKVIQGTDDEIVPFELVKLWVERLESVEFHAVEGAGHFFPKQLEQLGELLLSGLESTNQ